jgi:hypothetical protein
MAQFTELTNIIPSNTGFTEYAKTLIATLAAASATAVTIQ